GRRLVISRRESRPADNLWRFFEEPLEKEKCPEVPHPVFEALENEPVVPVGGSSPALALPDFVEIWRDCRREGYALERAREAALAGSDHLAAASRGEHGTEWGRVIHRLLQAKLEDPAADLLPLAGRLLREEESLEELLAPDAVELVESVAGSAIWRRALASARCLAEVPFEVCFPTPEGRARILRGVLDLAFREPAGWVIVDYKTDRQKEENLPALVERYREQLKLYSCAWEKVTGERVSEAGLYFTAFGNYIVV
ncbi:MAG TPA: PD-(D/E)XK nuclease family protein, partial [Candidatus Glassbacteria bacterium]|nr:PD-(D/E)XK nuclease family protein [Candidatus Glassbacteria bacterium]